MNELVDAIDGVGLDGLLEDDVLLFKGQRTAIHEWIASFAGGVASKEQRDAILGAIDRFKAAIAAARLKASAKLSYDEIANEYDALEAKKVSGSLSAHEIKRLGEVHSAMRDLYKEFMQADADFGNEYSAYWNSIPQKWKRSEHGAGKGAK